MKKNVKTIHRNRQMVNCERFKSWMIKDIRCWSSMVETKMRQKLDGQK
jgi:hypothetical protein